MRLPLKMRLQTLLRGSLREHPAPAGPTAWMLRGWYLALYLLGCLHWVLFFQSGRMALDFHDWTKEAKYLDVLRDAVQRRVLPLHSEPALLSPRFLTNPEVNLGPQVLLLPQMSNGAFVVLQVLLTFSVGFAGCLLLLNRLELSPLVGTIAILLFNFNGHITSHLAVGHFQWSGYFLLPFFVLLVLRLQDGTPGVKWSLAIGWVLFGLLILGAYHFALWSALLLLGLLVGHWSQRRAVGLGLLVALALGAVRLLPAAFDFAGVERAFISGFPTSRHLLQGLLAYRPPQEALAGPGSPLDWWEIDHFVGPFGLAFLAGGILLRYHHSEPSTQQSNLRLDLPLGAMVFLSLGPVWWPLAQVPGLSAERVTSRFLILPLVFWVFTSASAWQVWLAARTKPILTAGLAWPGVTVLAVDLLQHSRAWRVEATRRIFEIKTDVGSWSAAAHPDPVYRAVLLLGLGVTLISVLATAYVFLDAPGRRGRL